MNLRVTFWVGPAWSRKWLNATSLSISLQTRWFKSARFEPAGRWQVRVCLRGPQVRLAGKCLDWQRVGVAGACPRTKVGNTFLQIKVVAAGAVDAPIGVAGGCAN